MLRQQIEREIVRADVHDRAIDLGGIGVQLDRDFRACIDALAEARNPYDAVRAHQRRDHACAAAQRRGHNLIAYLTHGDAHPFILFIQDPASPNWYYVYQRPGGP